MGVFGFKFQPHYLCGHQSHWRSGHYYCVTNLSLICIPGCYFLPYASYIWVRSRNCGCLVTWFCYQLIVKPGNKTATVPWPDPYVMSSYNSNLWLWCRLCCCWRHHRWLRCHPLVPPVMAGGCCGGSSWSSVNSGSSNNLPPPPPPPHGCYM